MDADLRVLAASVLGWLLAMALRPVREAAVLEWRDSRRMVQSRILSGFTLSPLKRAKMTATKDAMVMGEIWTLGRLVRGVIVKQEKKEFRLHFQSGQPRIGIDAAMSVAAFGGRKVLMMTRGREEELFFTDPVRAKEKVKSWRKQNLRMGYTKAADILTSEPL